MEPELLNARQAAKLLGVSERHFWTMEATGRLGPALHRLGRCRRVSASELRAWIMAGTPSRERWQAMKAGARR